MTSNQTTAGSIPKAKANNGQIIRRLLTYMTPFNSIIFYAVLGLVLALSGSFVWLAVVSTLARLLSYILGVAALPVLERRIEKTEGQFQLRGGYLVPVVALLLCLWLITFASLTTWLTTAAFFTLGTVLYLASSRNKKVDNDI